MTASAPPDRLTLTEAERAVLRRIAGEGLHVVQLWAPWCPNSTGPLARGWAALAGRHPEVSFTFVTVWSGGASGRAELERLGLADRAEEILAPETGTREDKAGRARLFLGLPLTWIPTTWLFHRGESWPTRSTTGSSRLRTSSARWAGSGAPGSPARAMAAGVARWGQGGAVSSRLPR